MPSKHSTIRQDETLSYIWCGRREQRLSILVCIHHQCRHLREKEGLFRCKFKRRIQKLLEKKEAL